jgi:hypothetical protein
MYPKDILKYKHIQIILLRISLKYSFKEEKNERPHNSIYCLKAPSRG